MKKMTNSFERLSVGGVVGLLGALVSFFLFDKARDWERERYRLTLDRRAEVLATVLHREVDSHLSELSSIGAFFESTASVDRRQFHGFVSRILERHPGIQAFEWIPRVSASEVGALTAAARGHGAPAFRLTERDSDGRLVDAEAREEYFPVFYIEPVVGNEQALGFDVASDAVRGRALRQARDQAVMVATAPIRLVQDASVPGQLVFCPVYRTGDVPSTPAERRRQLAGFALAAYRIPAMIESALADLDTSGLDIRVVDRTAGGSETLFHRVQQGAGPRVPLRSIVLDTAGRRWALEFLGDPAAGTRSWLAPATLGAGIVLTLLLVSFLLSVLGRTEEVKRVVAVRTRQLEHTTELLEDARDRALVASRFKSQLLANMSHELRTPLGSIISFSELLVDGASGPLNEKQRRYGTEIFESGRHLLGLIDDVLDLSELEAGRSYLELEPVELPELLDDVMTSVKAQAKAKRIELRTDFESSLQPLTVDPTRFRQVLLNLLSNALKFTPGGGRVTVGARCTGGVAELSVSDTGPGIKPEHRELIFEEFRQVEEGDARGYQGTGLGLTLCRRFLDLMKGDIRVESELGQGSTFIVTLPVAHA